ncbi:hypothetical protein FEF65_01870 [Mariprofundus erugo]|uniref:Uncharacterized protein n=1 Tax=Mariprofundus erugo TaxID=2528639 RepID=A0A5R9H3R1_9PROT|nr:hypothetical protein [Mariprofundus erugo]TLS69254.1 hypothetical protein FEF65_01870 [Mariprofundus erugo]
MNGELIFARRAINQHLLKDDDFVKSHLAPGDRSVLKRSVHLRPREADIVVGMIAIVISLSTD